MYQPMPLVESSGLETNPSNLSIFYDVQNNDLSALTSMWVVGGSSRNIFYRNPIPLLEIETSSVNPHIEPLTETTSLRRDPTNELIPDELLEYDVIVQMPPKKKYTIQLDIKNVRRNLPRIVEP